MAGDRQRRTNNGLIPERTRITIIDSPFTGHATSTDILVVMPDIANACADIRGKPTECGTKVKIIKDVCHSTVADRGARAARRALNGGAANPGIAYIV